MTTPVVPHYKLTYFNAKGRGEYIRLLFAFAEVPHEEVRVPMDVQKWATEIKPKMPFGSLPLLEIDHGKEWIGQHLTIGRYLAKRFGVAGKDTLEQAKADMYVDGTAEMFGSYAFLPAVMSGNADMLKEAADKFTKETFHPWCDRYTKFLKQNGSGWFVGSSLTWADIYIAEWCDRVTSCFNPHALDGYPELKAHLERVNNIPSIAKWIKVRPSTPL